MHQKRFDEFNNGIGLCKKIQSGQTKLEEVIKLENIFKSNLNRISRGEFQKQEQKIHIKNIKLLY